MTGAGVEWTQREGVLPNIQSFLMSPDDAQALQGKTTPVNLEITPLDGTALKVTNLWVLNVAPGPNPFISEVTVADRRWFWSYGVIVGYYNMRRAVGVKRVIANAEQLEVNFDRAPDIAYWRWSLKDNKDKWQAYTMMVDVMTKVSEIERRYWGAGFKVKIDDRIGQKITNLPIEDLAISGIAGDQALNIARGFLPNAGVRVDNDGTVTLYSRASRDEEKIAAALMPEIWGQGHTDLVKNSVVRPKEIHVLFTRKVEVRLDFVEEVKASNETVTADGALSPDQRRMENVLPLPDYSLTVDGKALPQGSWVTVNGYMRALPELPIVGGSRPIDHDILQRAFIPQMDLWSALQLTGDRPAADGSLAPWVQRIAALERNYRTTFRINRFWTDRFMSWDCERLATVDPQTGQRGPSQAYGDYCILPSQRAIFRNSALGKPLDYAINKTAYPSSGILDQTAIPGPGIVSQIDHDQGVLRVDYAMDLNRTYEMVLPSQMEVGEHGEFMPTADITNRNRPIAFNAIIEGVKPPRLSASFKLATIITAVPASPNGAQQLHRIVVRPSDVADLLPDNAKTGEALGPIMEIRVGPGREVARIRWEDARASVTEKIFGLTEVDNNPAAQAAFSREVSAMCMNEGPSEGKFGASLNAIAKAEAAAVYASLADRYEGSMTGYMNGGVEIAGYAGEIRHSYKPNGETTTSMTLPPSVPQFNMLAFLSSSERAVLMRLAKP